MLGKDRVMSTREEVEVGIGGTTLHGSCETQHEKSSRCTKERDEGWRCHVGGKGVLVDEGVLGSM